LLKLNCDLPPIRVVPSIPGMSQSGIRIVQDVEIEGGRANARSDFVLLGMPACLAGIAKRISRAQETK
jgi:hypothetical protein